MSSGIERPNHDLPRSEYVEAALLEIAEHFYDVGGQTWSDSENLISDGAEDEAEVEPSPVLLTQAVEAFDRARFDHYLGISGGEFSLNVGPNNKALEQSADLVAEAFGQVAVILALQQTEAGKPETVKTLSELWLADKLFREYARQLPSLREPLSKHKPVVLYDASFNKAAVIEQAELMLGKPVSDVRASAKRLCQQELASFDLAMLNAIDKRRADNLCSQKSLSDRAINAAAAIMSFMHKAHGREQ